MLIWTSCYCLAIFFDVHAQERPQHRETAELYRLSQYEPWHMIEGRLKPELSGTPEYLDIIGVNYYQYNQWITAEDPKERSVNLEMQDPRYRPLREILKEVYERYQKSMFIAETGAENENRASWLRYICSEVRAALTEGVPIMGICWYPILNHPGWDDDRYCCNGLFDYPSENGERKTYQPLAEELKKQNEEFKSLLKLS